VGGDLFDIAGANDEDGIAGLPAGGSSAGGGGEIGGEFGRVLVVPPEVLEEVGGGAAGQWGFAGGIDGEQDEARNAVEGGGEVGAKGAGAGVAVGLGRWPKCGRRRSGGWRR